LAKKLRKAALVSIGIGLMTKDFVKKEVRKFIKDNKLTRAESRKLAKEFLKEANKTAAVLEGRMTKLGVQYERKAIKEVEKVFAASVKKSRAKLRGKGLVVRTTRVVAKKLARRIRRKQPKRHVKKIRRHARKVKRIKRRAKKVYRKKSRRSKRR